MLKDNIIPDIFKSDQTSAIMIQFNGQVPHTISLVESKKLTKRKSSKTQRIVAIEKHGTTC